MRARMLSFVLNLSVFDGKLQASGQCLKIHLQFVCCPIFLALWRRLGDEGGCSVLAEFSSRSFSLFNLVVVLQEQEECKEVLLIITPGPRLQLWMEPPRRAPAPPLQRQEDPRSLLLQGPSVRANRWLSAPWRLPCPPGMARLGPRQCKL